MADDNVIRPFAPIDAEPVYTSGFQDPQAPAPVTLPVIDATSLAGKEVPPRRWHVQDLIPAGTVTILNGDGGTGKSLISLQLAAATVMPGALWLARECMTGKCLFLTAEDDIDELHRRLVDIAANMQTDLADMDGLVISSLAGEDALMAVPEKGNLIKATPLFEALERQIKDLQPSLVVLDTLADLFGGEENQRAQARQFISMLRGLALHHDTTILLLAHPSLAGMSSGSGSSGSTGWSNSVRSRLYFERIKGEQGAEDDPDARILRTMKANYGATGGEIKVRWRAGVFSVDHGGETISSISAHSKADRIFLDLLRIYTRESRWVSPNKGHSYAPSIFADDARRDGITGHGFKGAMDRLLENGTIVVNEFGPPSRRTRRIIEPDFFRNLTGEAEE